MKKTLTAIAAAAAMTFSSAAFAGIPLEADIVFVVDESSGMPHDSIDVFDWIDDVAADLDVRLDNPRFALVGYANASLGNPTGIDETGRGNDDWMNLGDFTTATNFLNENGDIEDGYQAMHYFFDNYVADPNRLLAMILVTDEDRDVVDGTKDYANTLARFENSGWFDAHLNVVVDAALEDDDFEIASGFINNANANAVYLPDGSGGILPGLAPGSVFTAFGSTEADYIDLALATDGGVVDIFPLTLEDVAGSSSAKEALVQIKVDELDGRHTPIPSALVLSALGLLAMRRRLI